MREDDKLFYALVLPIDFSKYVLCYPVLLGSAHNFSQGCPHGKVMEGTSYEVIYSQLPVNSLNIHI